jgi:hypothetical protein
MSIKLFPLALVTSLLIAAGVAVVLLVGASKGGGGDTSTLEGYFKVLNTVQTGIGTSFTSISAKYPNAFPDASGGGGNVKEAVGYFKESQVAMADGVKKLAAIEPPAEAAQQHAALVKAAQGVQAAFGDLQTGAASASDSAGLQTLLNTSSTTAFGDFTTACQALQDIATQNDIPVNLKC